MDKTEKILQVKIDDLIPYVNNARTHSKEQITKLRSSLREFGFVNPVLIDKDKNIIAGHGRVMAGKEEGLKEVPCVLVEHLNETQKKAYILADNRLAEDAGWDNELLKIEFESLEDMEFDLSITGFELDEINFEKEKEVEEDNFDVDGAIEEIEEPIAKRGDVWKLGRHRLMCGDSTLVDDVERLMDGKKADMVFTDPPYGYKYESNYQKSHTMLKNDDKILNFLPLAYDYMEGNSCIFLCTSHQVVDKWKNLVQDVFIYKNMIVWVKNNWSMGDLKGSFAGQHEIILFAHKGKVSLNGKRDTDIWEFKRVPPNLHPTMKPVELISYAINKITSNRVLDLFGGSGSTLIACEQTNRICYMMELDEKYVDVIIKRWEDFTGQKAELIN